MSYALGMPRMRRPLQSWPSRYRRYGRLPASRGGAFASGIASIGDGFASIADGFADIVAPRPLPRPLTPQEAARADAEALRGDWEAVGADLDRALGRVRNQRG